MSASDSQLPQINTQAGCATNLPFVVAANIWFWWLAVILTIVSVLTVVALIVGYLKNVTALKYPSRKHQQLD